MLGVGHCLKKQRKKGLFLLGVELKLHKIVVGGHNDALYHNKLFNRHTVVRRNRW